MGNRSHVYPTRRELTLEEKLTKEKERVRKLQQTRQIKIEADSGKNYHPGEVGLDVHDPLLDALIKEHPEKDPANLK